MKENAEFADTADIPVSIGQAVELLRHDYPDISPSTLRFLEGEGLLHPERTPGGHRLYSTGDLERIRTIRTMQRRRMPIEEIRQRLSRLDELASPEDLSNEFYERAIAGDLSGAAQLIRDADRFGLPLETNFVDVIGRAMQKIGTGWERGNLLVGQEKEATELAKDLIAELTARHAAPDMRDQIILAAGVEGELHDLGLRMVAGLLREQGYPVHLLGANVPANFLIESVRLREPDVLLLGATLSERLPALVATIKELRRAFPGHNHPLVIVGGPVAAEHHQDLQNLGVVPVEATGVRAATRAVLVNTAGPVSDET